MDYLVEYERPSLREPYLLAAFTGWPDAGEVATGALRYLITKLQATRFAQIDQQEFFVFTFERPTSAVVAPSKRIITWPSIDFYYWKDPDNKHDLVILLGIEPHLKWRTFTKTVAALMIELGVKKTVTFGGTFDSLPHTLEAQMTGHSNDHDLQKRMKELGVHFTRYQGPTSIHAPLMEELFNQGITGASIWGHAPDYVHFSPNIKISYGLLQIASSLLDMPFDLEEAKAAATALDRKIEQSIDDDPDLGSYVSRLKEAYEDLTETGDQAQKEINWNPEAIVKDLEEFLRGQRENSQGDR